MYIPVNHLLPQNAVECNSVALNKRTVRYTVGDISPVMHASVAYCVKSEIKLNRNSRNYSPYRCLYGHDHTLGKNHIIFLIIPMIQY